jgi:hypothetical protein
VTVSFLPEPEDVAAVLVARTFNTSSTEEGEFTEDTRPTEAQVEVLIERSGDEVRSRLGQDIDEDTDETNFLYAKQLVAVRAAMWIELSYFPEQTNIEDSIYEQLRELYESGLAALIAALSDTSATSKGMYSLRLRSDVGAAGLLSTAEQLP